MSKRVISSVKAVSVGLLATAIMLGTDRASLAADGCLAGPNRPPAAGGHWYYRVDRAANRKCWYLVEPAGRALASEAMEPQPASEPPPQLPFGSFFASLSAGFTGSKGVTTGTQPDPTSGDARIMQSARPDDRRNDEAAPRRAPRMARHPDSEAALVPKQPRPARARPPVERADEQQPVASPDQVERDALFQEFLRWKDRRAP
jgi:hypothetical protein